MARRYTFSVGDYYHVYHHGVDRRIIASDETDCLRFLTTLFLCNSGVPYHRSDYLGTSEKKIFLVEKDTPLVDVGAYAVTHNQISLLLYENSAGGISAFMQKLLTAYTMYFNIRHKRSGPLFSGHFHAKPITGDHALKKSFADIHLLPFTHNDTTIGSGDLFSYPFSSLPDYLGKDRPEKHIITPEAFPKYFSLDPHLAHEKLFNWKHYEFPEEIDSIASKKS